MSGGRSDGGPAFPVPLAPGQSWQGMAPFDGMTLRDYFAAHTAPPEKIARCWGEHVVGPYPKSPDGMTDAPFGRPVIDWWLAVDAAWRYATADAMLKARQA